MATQVQFRGGTTTEHSSFNGAAREVTVDTTKQTLVVQDGSTNGGFPLLGEKNADNVKVYFGTGDDLQIYHDGSHSHIKDSGTGILSVNTNQFQLTNAADTEVIINAVENGNVALYYDNSKKFETFSGGARVQGQVAVVGSGVSLSIADSGKAAFGDGDDLKIWHQTSNSYITSTGANLTLRAAGHLYLQDIDGNTMADFNDGAAVELYYNGGKKFETISNGVKVNGTIDIYHDGSHSYLKNTSGIQFINGNTIYMRTEDSSEDYFRANQNGAVELYYDGSKKFETTSGGVKVTGIIDAQEDVYLRDNKELHIGDGSDLQIYHDGSNSYIKDTGTGLLAISASALNITNAAGTEDGIKFVENGAVNLYYDNSKKLETHTNGVHMSGSMYLPDNQIAGFGDVSNPDLRILHNGSDSLIVNSTGNLYQRTTGNLYLQVNGGSNENAIVAKTNGAVELYYNNAKKFETNAEGVKISGYLEMEDNQRIQMGTGDDLHIYHDGTNSYINNTNGALYLKTAASNSVYILDNNNDTLLSATDDAGVVLCWDNATKLETNADGIEIYGNCLMDGDNRKVILGASDDLQIYHDGTDTYFKNHTTGNVHHRARVNWIVSVNATDGGADHAIKALQNGAVELYYDNVKAFETGSNGNYHYKHCDPYVADSFNLGHNYRWKRLYTNNAVDVSSDRNTKNTIFNSDLGLSFINQLRPVSFKKNNQGDSIHYGLIAQEVEDVIINTGKSLEEFSAISKPTDKTMGLAYSEFISPLIKAVQELTTKIETLEAKVAALEAG